jgi:NADPH:quinone reductase-like Zn-dependent oxidoreductase
LTKPRIAVQGAEFAGEIDAVGGEVKSFKPGDRVFGLSGNFGAHAEYLCMPAAKEIVPTPASMSDVDAAAVCEGALTGLVFLRDRAKLEPGQTILINGASGAVGSYAVQLAKYYGAHVTGVCSTRNIERVKSLGADEVIDYTQADFTKRGETYDVIFDAIGKSSFAHCKPALAPTALYMTTVPSMRIVLDMLLTARSRGKKAILETAGLKQTKANLAFVAQLYEQGKLRPVIDRCYPLEQMPDAHRYVDTERKRGNVIILIGGQA